MARKVTRRNVIGEMTGNTEAATEPVEKEVVDGNTGNSDDSDNLLDTGDTETVTEVDELVEEPIDLNEEEVVLTDEEIAAAEAESAELVAEGEAASQPEPEVATGPVPAHNGSGYRNKFINPKGQLTTMEDDTAERFYTDPKFYSYVYDANRHDHIHVSFCRWADDKGNAIGGQVGDRYELDT